MAINNMVPFNPNEKTGNEGLLQQLGGPAQLSMDDITALISATSENKSEWRDEAEAAGVVASILKFGVQLKTGDIYMKPLHIDALEMAQSIDKQSGETKDYPVMTFAEFPGCYYNGGTMFLKITMALALAAGDNPAEDRRLPNLNARIKERGPIGVVLYQQPGKNYLTPQIIGV